MQTQDLLNSFASLSSVDWAMLAVLVLSVLIGAWRGVVYEVLNVVGWIAAFLASQLLAPQVLVWWGSSSLSEPVRQAIAMVLIFVVVAFVSGLLAKMISKMVSAVGLSLVDATLGAAFGLVRGSIVLLVATTAINTTSYKKSDWWKESLGAGVLTVVLQDVKALLPENLMSKFDKKN